MKRLIIITGNGKGKTTAGIGIIIRSLGHQRKCAFIKFFKSTPSGEDKILKKLGVKILKFKISQFFNPKKIPNKLEKETKTLWEKTQKLANEFDLIVLDEINLVLAADLIKKSEFKNFIKNTKAHIVCTGRAAPLWLKKIADTISIINDQKNTGISTKGIEE